MDLTAYKVTAIIYPHEVIEFGRELPIVDEGSLFRIGDNHVFEKFRIQEIREEDGHVILCLKDKQVILVVKKNQ